MTCPITQLATTVTAVQTNGRPHADQSPNSFIFDSLERWRVTRDHRNGHSDANGCARNRRNSAALACQQSQVRGH
jgi:hypothetical protein